MNQKNKKFFLLIFFFSSVLLLWPKISFALLPLQALAGPLLSAITSTVLYIIWEVSRFLVQGTAGFFDIVLNLDVTYTHESFVYIGWQVVRDFTNLFFVIALIIIGIATALRIQGYHARKTLFNLILIALLINFSMVIAGFILDAATIIMNYFLSEIGDVGDLFANQAQLLWGNEIDALIGSLTGKLPAELLFAIIFNLLTATVLFLFALLFLVRYIVIWFLVIVSPFAFFSYILPLTRENWHKWWNAFIHWAFLGIPAVFTLYLSAQLLSAFSASPIVVSSDNFWSKIFPNIEQIMPFIIVMIFSLIGFYLTITSSAIGSNYIIQGAKSRIPGR